MLSLDEEFTQTDRPLASISLRFVAWALDIAIIIAPWKIFFGRSLRWDRPKLETWLVVILFAWLYSALMESSDRRGTVGKIITNLSVTDMDGDQITFGKASIRFFGKIISSLILGAGYIMASFQDKKQALHDTLAKTLVVKV